MRQLAPTVAIMAIYGGLMAYAGTTQGLQVYYSQDWEKEPVTAAAVAVGTLVVHVGSYYGWASFTTAKLAPKEEVVEAVSAEGTVLVTFK